MTAAPPADLLSRFGLDLEAVAGPGREPLALAVSGGPDSLALLLLAHAARPGRVSAATVDHGLRSASAGEASAVGRLCAEIGVPHAVLAATVEAAGEGLQSAARKARYAALAQWMDERGLRLLLTAHHCDDQAETLLMRLNRGSGVAGLAGVRAAGAVPGTAGRLRLCRPLLGWRRSELEALVDAAGIAPARDPSNADERFDRVRVRRRLAEAPWLDPRALARSAALLAEAEAALDWTAGPLFAARAELGEGTVTLRPHGLPSELLRRLVLRCLRQLAPEASPRGEALAAFVARLEAAGTATLSGIKATGGETWHFERAPPRRPSSRA
ncbi:MAG TPA: tRNA lysidine(34) synthetase TilS [Allosphingosinicella sp.]|jgi:tRNA(Ile)-lysidine synthase|nr:tRNA lysidine(34) synthetase TilS [Allosphingosinicella sp.]